MEKKTRITLHSKILVMQLATIRELLQVKNKTRDHNWCLKASKCELHYQRAQRNLASPGLSKILGCAPTFSSPSFCTLIFSDTASLIHRVIFSLWLPIGCEDHLGVLVDIIRRHSDCNFIGKSIISQRCVLRASCLWYLPRTGFDYQSIPF